jgi:hypothetical protein
MFQTLTIAPIGCLIRLRVSPLIGITKELLREVTRLMNIKIELVEIEGALSLLIFMENQILE